MWGRMDRQAATTHHHPSGIRLRQDESRPPSPSCGGSECEGRPPEASSNGVCMRWCMNNYSGHRYRTHPCPLCYLSASVLNEKIPVVLISRWFLGRCPQARLHRRVRNELGCVLQTRFSQSEVFTLVSFKITVPWRLGRRSAEAYKSEIYSKSMQPKFIITHRPSAHHSLLLKARHCRASDEPTREWNVSKKGRWANMKERHPLLYSGPSAGKMMRWCCSIKENSLWIS